MKTRKEKNTLFAISIVIALEAMILGFVISWIFLEKPMNNEQIQKCQEIAQDYFEQKDLSDDGYYFEKNSENSITVKSTKNRGSVIVNQKDNGQLVVTIDLETGEAIKNSLLIGLLILAYAIIQNLFFIGEKKVLAEIDSLKEIAEE